jgi:hypothetical protein
MKMLKKFKNEVENVFKPVLLRKTSFGGNFYM